MSGSKESWNEGHREMLSRAIIEILDSWPEQDREVFRRAHYDGLSPQEIAEASHLDASTVQGILQDCEQRLRIALRPFREGGLTSSSAVCGSAGYARSGCCSH